MTHVLKYLRIAVTALRRQCRLVGLTANIVLAGYGYTILILYSRVSPPEEWLMIYRFFHGMTLVMAWMMTTLVSAANLTPALSLSDGLSGTPGQNSVHGWRFDANNSIRVTHLGLYDHLGDGFLIDHPIGLFRFSDALLLTSGTMLAGIDIPLLNGFRYIDTPDVTLKFGESYVIAFHSSEGFKDRAITNPTGLTVNLAITFRAALANTGGFSMPMSNQESQHRIGPNFLFAIPEPSTLTSATVILMAYGLSRLRTTSH
jgi:hypothetical protein